MNVLRLLLRQDPWRLWVALLVGLAAGVLNALLIAVIKYVREKDLYESLPWILGFAGLVLLAAGAGYVAQFVMVRLAYRAVNRLRLELGDHILATPLQKVEKIGQGRILSVLAEDATLLGTLLPKLPRLVIELATLVAGAGIVAWMDLRAMALLLGCAAVGLLLHRVQSVRALAHIRKAREATDEMFHHFRALGDGLKQLKLSQARRNTFRHRELTPNLEEVAAGHVRGRSHYMLAEASTRVVFFGLLGCLLFLVPTWNADQVAPTGDGGLLHKDPAALLMVVLFLYRPLGFLLSTIPELGRAQVAIERIESFGQLLPQSTEGSDAPVTSPTSFQTLQLEGITFRHEEDGEDRFDVGPIDLTFHPGEVVFVMGGNGSGKTTLAKLLTSLYTPASGRILVDGKEITADGCVAYRELFAAVFQDFYLFQSLPRMDQQELAQELLKDLGLEDKVTIRDGRYSTTSLSHGQRKRLALVSASLEDKPFFLFDEWAADQDPHFKRIFYHEVLPRLKAQGKAAFVISHDERYFDVADRCIKMEEGRVVSDTRTEQPAPRPTS